MQLERTAAGLLGRHDSTNPLFPFSLAQWGYDPSLAVSVDPASHVLLINGAAGNWPLRYLPAGVRADAYVQAGVTVQFPNSAAIGPIARANTSLKYIGGAIPFDGIIYLMSWFSGNDLLREIQANVTLSQVSPPVGNRAKGAVYTGEMLVEGAAASVQTFNVVNSAGALVLSGPVSGYVGVMWSAGAAGNPGAVSRFIACASRYVKVSGLSAGQIVKVRQNSGTVIKQAAAVAGVASVDFKGIQLDGTAFDVAVYAADGVTLVTSLAPAGGVWPGDVYGVVVPVNHAPARPNLVVVDARINDADLIGSVFSDQDAGAVHHASQWQVQLAGGDWSAPEFDSGADPVDLVSITATGLAANEQHEARVRYQDELLAWSAWSLAEPFTTQPEPGTFIPGPPRPDTDWTTADPAPVTNFAECGVRPATAWGSCNG